jgi:PilZ domain-containing protein
VAFRLDIVGSQCEQARAATMTIPPIERRAFQRFAHQLPIVITTVAGGTQLQGVTRDTSRTGVFFYTDAPPPVESALEFKMIMPAEITLDRDRRVVGKGTVLRVEATDSNRRVGVAMRVDSDIFR